MLQSSVAWIDFSEQDRRKMMEVVSLFKQRDTRDELGLGSIRDAFADLFFPGTTTLQTRARYFLLVPWLYLDCERHRVPSSKIAEWIKRDESKLIQTLQASDDPDGVIGQRSGSSLHRFPSSIYWNGLQRWGILRYAGSQSQYHRWLDRFYDRQRNRQLTEGYSREPIEGWGGGNWDAKLAVEPSKESSNQEDKLITPPEGFPDQVDFQITPEEAAYLREKVMLSCPDSLLAILLDRCKPVGDDVKFIWQHPQIGEFPAEQQDRIAHARNFSEAMHSAILLYNLMLAELSQQDDLTDQYRADLAAWQEEIEAHYPVFAAWDRRAFWALLEQGYRIPFKTKAFVDTWLDLLFKDSRSLPDLTDHEKARQTVQEREAWLKRNRSRLKNQRHLEMWSGAAGVGQLDYRWPVSRRITNDILRGFGAKRGR